MTGVKESVVSAVQASLDYLRSRFYERTARERRLIVAASVVGAAFLALLAVTSAIESSRQRAHVIAAKEKALTQVVELSRRYAALRDELASVERDLEAGGTSSLFAEIEGMAADTLGREHIGGIEPSAKRLTEDLDEESVELTLNGVSLRGIVELLYRLEKEERHLSVSRMRIKKRFNEPHLFDLQLSISRLRPVAKGEA